MFLIVPIGHDEGVVRVWPWVTTALIAVNTVIFFGLWGTVEASMDLAAARADEAAGYWCEHPMLEPESPLSEMLAADPGFVERCRAAPAAGLLASPSLPQIDGEPIRPDDLPLDQVGLTPEQQALAKRIMQRPEDRDPGDPEVLAGLTASMREAMNAMPYQRFGDIPAARNPATLFTSQFLHGDLLHLIGNMWFLWLVGCNVEDRWGRWLFAVFYLLGGAIAGLGSWVAVPDQTTPGIGASGAVAAVMGAFLVRQATTKIGFVFLHAIFLRPRAVRFQLPAYVVLPFWAALEATYGAVFGHDDGVSHWVHVAGFLFGVAAGLVIWRAGWEESHSAALEERAELEDPRVTRANELMASGQAAVAAAELRAAADADPRQVDLRLALARAAELSGLRDELWQALVELLELYARGEAYDAARSLAEELRAKFPDRPAPARVLLAYGRFLERRDDPVGAAEAYEQGHGRGLSGPYAVQAALAHARLLLRIGSADDARALLTAALHSPHLAADLRPHVEAELRRLTASGRA